MKNKFEFKIKNKKYKVEHIDMLIWKFPSEFELKKQLFNLSRHKSVKYKKIKSTKSFQYYTLFSKKSLYKNFLSMKYDYFIPIQSIIIFFIKDKAPGRYYVKTPFNIYEVLKDVDFITSLKPVEEKENFEITESDIKKYMTKNFKGEENDFIRI
ncbi:MAG: hypothetical protein ACQESN_05310 [Thermotogota bacterium]